MRICKSCGQELSEFDFYRNKARKDGFGFYCKECTKKKNAESDLHPKRGPYNQAHDGAKRCSHCKLTKPVEQFHASTLRADGLDKRCKECAAELHAKWRKDNLGHSAEYMREWRANNLERSKEIDRKKTYGVPYGWYAEQLAAQNGKCAICDTEEPGGRGTFHIDHCHDSQKVRALLCQTCNLGLGHMKHDVRILEAAIQYLRQHHEEKEEGI